MLLVIIDFDKALLLLDSIYMQSIQNMMSCVFWGQGHIVQDFINNCGELLKLFIMYQYCYFQLLSFILYQYCCLVTGSNRTPLRPHRLQPTRLLCPCDFPSKNTGVGCHFLLQGTFSTQGSNTHLLHQQEDSLPLSYLGSHVPILAYIKW